MGAVYRAIDTRLNREVAIKVLPAELAEDAARMARFEREAQLLATLNHPNIAGIYGIEQAPSSWNSSPDGRLAAYVSDETGRNEVYLCSAAHPAGRIALSSEGGSEPKWSPNSKEIFYRRGDGFRSVGVNSGAALSVTETRKLFAMPALYGRYSNHAGYVVRRIEDQSAGPVD
jgi:serine/threonine protein kinase